MKLDPVTLALAFNGLDDATVDYISKVHPSFEDLKHATSAVAGVLVLAATGICEAPAEHPALVAAYQLSRDAGDAVQRLTPPLMAVHFQRHLARSSQLLDQTLEAIFRSVKRSHRHKDTIDILRLAWHHLSAAACALPGFSTVDLEESCCSMHVKNLLGRAVLQ